MRPLLLSDNANFREANKGVRELRDEKLKGLSIGYAKGKTMRIVLYIYKYYFLLSLRLVFLYVMYAVIGPYTYYVLW